MIDKKQLLASGAISASLFAGMSNPDLNNFIETNRKYEGGSTPNVTHVPVQHGKVMGHSGVTNREGIDFGQQTKEDLKKWGVDDYLIEKVTPMLGIRGQDALNFKPSLTENESKEISSKYLEYSDKELSDLFDTYKNAKPEIKNELIQYRTHLGRLGSKVAAVLNKDYTSQEKLAKDLAAAIKETNKGDKNRQKRTIKALLAIKD